MNEPAPDLHLRSVGLYNVGIAWGAVGVVALLAVATIGQGLKDSFLHRLLLATAVLVLAVAVLFEVRARTAYLDVSGRQLRWRLLLREGLWSHEQPIERISRLAVSPNHDVRIFFRDRPDPLLLSAKEFRPADLERLLETLSSATGHDLAKG